jgi:negative regulator of sigma-B (phosphoserine phosphatase)
VAEEDVSAIAADFLTWGVASRPLASEPVSGDLHVLAPFEGGVLVAVIDGLGHGLHAAEAAQVAAEVLGAEPQRPVHELLAACHEALIRTRGVVASLASIQRHGLMTWTGIGNVEAVMVRAGQDGTPQRFHMAPRGGVLGAILPSVRATQVQLVRGDTLVLASDGLHARFVEGITTWELPQAMADRLLGQFARDNDDALVWIGRYGEVTR